MLQTLWNAMHTNRFTVDSKGLENLKTFLTLRGCRWWWAKFNEMMMASAVKRSQLLPFPLTDDKHKMKKSVKSDKHKNSQPEKWTLSLSSLLQPKELNNLIAIRFSFLSLFMLFFLLCATEFFYSLNIFDWRGPSEHPASFTRHKAYTHYPNLKRCSFPPLRTARPTDRRCSFSSPLKVLQFFGSLLKPYSCTI